MTVGTIGRGRGAVGSGLAGRKIATTRRRGVITVLSSSNTRDATGSGVSRATRLIALIAQLRDDPADLAEFAAGLEAAVDMDTYLLEWEESLAVDDEVVDLIRRRAEARSQR